MSRWPPEGEACSFAVSAGGAPPPPPVACLLSHEHEQGLCAADVIFLFCHAGAVVPIEPKPWFQSVDNVAWCLVLGGGCLVWFYL